MHNGQTNNLIEIDCLVLEKDYMQVLERPENVLNLTL